MDEREEAQLTRYFDSVRLAAKQIDSAKLDMAIRQGMEQSNNKRASSMLQRGWGWAAAGLLACLVLVVAFGANGSLNVRHSFSSIGTSTSYPDHILELMLPEMKPAVKELYQPIGKSGILDGTEVTIDGVMADGRTILVFYTLKDQTGKQAAKNISPGILNSDGGELEDYDIQQEWSFTNPSLDSRQVKHKSLQLIFDHGEAPTELIFTASLQSNIVGVGSSDNNGMVKLPISWSSQPYEGMIKEVPIQQALEVDGHSLLISQVTLRPLSTLIEFEPQQVVNSFKTENLKASLSNYSKGDPQSRRSYTAGYTLHQSMASNQQEKFLSGIAFNSLYYENWEEALLQIDVYGVYPDTKRTYQISIDTEKELASLGSGVDRVEVLPGNESTEVKLHIERNPDGDINTPLRLSPFFFDRHSSVFRLMQQEGPLSAQQEGGSAIFKFNLDSESYAQPLAFTLTETLGDHYKPQEFMIKLK